MQPAHSQGITMQPSHSLEINMQPSHSQGITMQPSHSLGITLQPSHSLGINMQPSHSLGINMQPSQRTGQSWQGQRWCNGLARIPLPPGTRRCNTRQEPGCQAGTAHLGSNEVLGVWLDLCPQHVCSLKHLQP